MAALANDTSVHDGEREIRIRREILKNGIPGITDDDIDILAKKAGMVSIEVMTAIRDLTVEYNESRIRTADEAKKKSKAAPSPSGNN